MGCDWYANYGVKQETKGEIQFWIVRRSHTIRISVCAENIFVICDRMDVEPRAAIYPRAVFGEVRSC